MAIVLWLIVLSGVYSRFCYGLVDRWSLVGLGIFTLPTLVLGPLVLVMAHRWLGINLLYPVQLLASADSLIIKAFVPSLILLLASGLAFRIRANLHREFALWSSRPFANAARAFGFDAKERLRGLVIKKSLLEAWSESMPWLLGELFVVECVFNAPGLGLDLWHNARTRMLDGMLMDILGLALIYLGMGILLILNSRSLGRKLSTYL